MGHWQQKSENLESVLMLRHYRAQLCSKYFLISLFLLNQQMLRFFPVPFPMNGQRGASTYLWEQAMKYFSNQPMNYLPFGHLAIFGLQRPYLPHREGSLGSAVAARRGSWAWWVHYSFWLPSAYTPYFLKLVHDYLALVIGRNGKCSISLSIVGSI